MTEKDLRNVIIASPAYHYVEPETQRGLDDCAGHGARIIRSTGQSDITQHRCQIAVGIEEALGAHPELEVVLWLDSDQTFIAHDILILRAWLLAANGTAAGAGMRSPVSVTGAYVAKGGRNELALQRLGESEPDLSVALTPELELQLPPVLSGMGFLMQTRSAFLRHCQESRRVTVKKKSPGAVQIMRMPVITASGAAPLAEELQWHPFDHPEHRMPDPGELILVRRRSGYLEAGEPVPIEWNEDQDMARMGDHEAGDRWVEWRPVDPEWGWSSEDFTYCQWEWDHGRPVYLAPVLIGHREMVTRMPDAATRMRGKKDRTLGDLFKDPHDN